MEDRIGRDELFMAIATMVARRGTCARAKVGAVAVIDGRIVSSGYAGAVSGDPHCLEVGCAIDIDKWGQHCKRSVHAEANVVAWAARNGAPLEFATIYCTHSPCIDCAKLLINAGVGRVVWMASYGDPSGVMLLTEHVKTEQYSALESSS